MTIHYRNPTIIAQGIPQMFHRERGKSQPDRVLALSISPRGKQDTVASLVPGLTV